MAVIRRSFITLTQNNVAPLYKALVRRQLDYATSIWSSYKQKYNDAIENESIPYQETFDRLKLPTLAYRRALGDI